MKADWRGRSEIPLEWRDAVVGDVVESFSRKNKMRVVAESGSFCHGLCVQG